MFKTSIFGCKIFLPEENSMVNFISKCKSLSLKQKTCKGKGIYVPCQQEFLPLIKTA